MDIDFFHAFCLKKPGATASFPFDEDTLVFKVGEKIFALANIVSFTRINVKYEPEKAIELRASNPSIVAGWHMHKRHWNTLNLDGGLTDRAICEHIDHSYELVLRSLSKKSQTTLQSRQ